MKTTFVALGVVAAALAWNHFDADRHATLTELPRLSASDPACGAVAINDKGQIIGWSGEPG
jgi:hypothetical protein